MRRYPFVHFALCLVACVACSCSTGTKSSGFDKETKDAGKEPGAFVDADSGGTGGMLGGETPGTPKAPGCTDAAKLVYVVSDQMDLYSFQPDTLIFTKVGTLNCPGAGTAVPNSMAVDRSGAAWVNYSDGSLFKVSTADASCTATKFSPGQHGFVRFGMAFSSNSAGSNDETLYVCGISDSIIGVAMGKGMATIDLGSMTLAPIADFTGTLKGKGAELTGSGDAHLFGFFTTTPAAYAEIDMKSAATPSPQSLQGVSTGTAWAFSFWGGDFWFYTANLASSDVTRLKKATDNSISVVKSQIGFRIVGAGVSTCAPTTPTK